MSKLNALIEGMENKGMRINMKKTKFMVTGPGIDVLRYSGAFPCAVCRHGVGSSNAIVCSQCKLLVPILRGAAVSRAELLQTQTMFAQGVVDKLVQLMAE